MPLLIEGVPGNTLANQFTINNILDNVDLKTFNSQLYFDLQNTNSLTLDSGVRQIADLSGNNRHALQNTITSRPEYTHILGMPCVRFNVGASNRFMSFDDQFCANSLYQIFVVAGRCRESAMIQYGSNLGSSKSLHFGWLNNSTFRFSHYAIGDTYDAAVVAPPLHTPALIQVGLNNTGKFIKLDGYPVKQSTIAYKLIYTGSPSYFGTSGVGDIGLFIHEYIGFNRILSTEESNLIEAYLARKWKTTNRFNPNHVHYNLAIAA